MIGKRGSSSVDTATTLLPMINVNSTRKGGVTIAFPDVCKTPAPPAPFTPIPYPNAQFQENLQAANKADASAQAGSRKAQTNQRMAIDNLYIQTGIKAKSATQAVIIGKSVNGKAVRTSPFRTAHGDEAGTLKGVVSRKLGD